MRAASWTSSTAPAHIDPREGRFIFCETDKVCFWIRGKRPRSMVKTQYRLVMSRWVCMNRVRSSSSPASVLLQCMLPPWLALHVSLPLSVTVSLPYSLYTALFSPPPPKTPPSPFLFYLLLCLFLLKSQSSSFASRPGRAGLLFLGFY